MRPIPRLPSKTLVAVGLLASGAVFASSHASAADDSISDDAMKKGEEMFLVNCKQCHGTKGTAGAPLKGNENLADANYLATTILTGPGYMTGFAEHLDDEQIALISTYVRNSWGNAFGPVTPEEVAEAR